MKWSVMPVTIHKVNAEQNQVLDDVLAVEEPLEIRLVFSNGTQRRTRSISITMRTPGNDFELAAGFLFTEKVVQHPDQIVGIQYCNDPDSSYNSENVVAVTLANTVTVDIQKLERHFYTTSSCGVCGKSSLEALEQAGCAPIVDKSFRVDSRTISRLPDLLRQGQRNFDRTGGLHASGIFDALGKNIAHYEDVGRHNAVDKAIGYCWLNDQVPLTSTVMVVSGRTSFDIVQKALWAQIPILVAVGAPSSLAVSLAKSFGMTLIGFTRVDGFNIYTHPDRIRGLI